METDSSDNELFGIKDPRPITAKFNREIDSQPNVYFSDSDSVADITKPVTPLNLEEMDIENSLLTTSHTDIIEHDGKENCDDFNETISTKIKSLPARREKPKKKVYRRINTYSGTSNNTSVYIKSAADFENIKNKADNKFGNNKYDKLTKSDNLLKPRKNKRKKKNPTILSTTQKHAEPPKLLEEKNMNPGEKSSPFCVRKPDTRQKNKQENNLNVPKAPRRTSKDRITQLAVPASSRSTHRSTTWSPHVSRAVETIHDDITTFDTSQSVEVINSVEESSDPATFRTSPQRKVRYTNLSLSMPNTRDGRRTDTAEDRNSWLFECKNIWSPSRQSMPTSRESGPEHTDDNSAVRVAVKDTSVSKNHMNSTKINNRFVYSMKNATAAKKNAQTMRTVKQGSFVLMGTIKTIGDVT